jgi:putative phosphoesterase
MKPSHNPPPPDAADRDPPLLTVGIIADTHIPDRVRALHPCILPRLREARVGHILHAGDISLGRVLDELREIAPVTAVRGNRDVLAGPLEMIERLDLAGVSVALTHGHGGWLPYLWDKVQFWLAGYRLERYQDRLVQAALPARVVVFGHTHHAVLTLHKDVLLFNPGSASIGSHPGRPPSMGLLHIYPGGRAVGKILPLEGFEIKRRNWARMS